MERILRRRIAHLDKDYAEGHVPVKENYLTQRDELVERLRTLTGRAAAREEKV
jgi:hypothetical protein